MPEMVAPRASRFLPQARRIVGSGDENAFSHKSSPRAGSLVPGTGEARKSVGKARKSEPARELLIFEFRPSRGVKSAFHMCQII